MLKLHINTKRLEELKEAGAADVPKVSRLVGSHARLFAMVFDPEIGRNVLARAESRKQLERLKAEAHAAEQKGSEQKSAALIGNKRKLGETEPEESVKRSRLSGTPETPVKVTSNKGQQADFQDRLAEFETTGVIPARSPGFTF